MSDKKVISPVKIADYRVSRPAFFLEKGGKTVMAAQQLSSFTIDGSNFVFLTPNSITLSYSKSWKEYSQALKIYDEIVRPNLKPGITYDVTDKDLRKLYDYFEHIQASIISIYSAIEALGNVAIPNGYSQTVKNNKGVMETWSKENIERWKATTEKIGKIVPEILKIASPSTEWFWQDFLALKAIRDDIIHQKQSARDPNKADEEFLSILLNPTIFTKIMAGFGLIRYFCDNNKGHLYFPILENEVPVDVNIVETFDGMFEFKMEDNPPEEGTKIK